MGQGYFQLWYGFFYPLPNEEENVDTLPNRRLLGAQDPKKGWRRGAEKSVQACPALFLLTSSQGQLLGSFEPPTPTLFGLIKALNLVLGAGLSSSPHKLKVGRSAGLHSFLFFQTS